ncbi:MAG: hypothetical protein FJ104_12940 [Deltaproteobacteria bacterium]|nr:hypothetical protein [Deltaproteobacteria bacterium]
MGNDDLPPLEDEVVSWARARELLQDLLALPDRPAILLKGGAELRASGGAPSLEEAFARLERGETHGVQLRYRFAGSEVCDTLLATAGGVRIVRIRR